MATPPSVGITETDVHTAALALTEEGVYPSVLAIRRRLGNRGSSTTIAKHLRTWRAGPGQAALAQILTPADGAPADPEIEALLKLHPRVVDKVRAQVETRFRGQIQALEQALAATRDEADQQHQAMAEAVEARTAADGRSESAVA